MVVFTLLSILSVGVRVAHASVACGAGHFLTSNSTCLPCPDGTYINESNHESLKCAHCLTPDSSLHEIVLANCTKTTQTVVGCETAYFRRGDICVHRKGQ